MKSETKVKLFAGFFVVFVFATVNLFGQQEEKSIKLDVEINAPVSEVWKAWTTEDGVKSFFAPGCKINFKVDGEYEMYFDPLGQEGTRGGEGNKILAVDPERMFSFTWNAPPLYPEIRKQKTVVILHFEKMDEKKTMLHFIQIGWGESEEWNNVYEYFSYAWSKIVLPRLQYRFDHGPIDWNNPPQM